LAETGRAHHRLTNGHGYATDSESENPMSSTTTTSTTSLTHRSGRDPSTALPANVVAVYTTEEDLGRAVKHLEQGHYDMRSISVGRGEQRHVIGFETPRTHTARWAKWGGLAGCTFGAFLLVPGLGDATMRGRLLLSLLTAGVGAGVGALGGALTSVGMPEEGTPLYGADVRADRFFVIAHGTPSQVEQARTLLGRSAHERIDHHQDRRQAPPTRSSTSR
jgi:hypothetical protein